LKISPGTSLNCTRISAFLESKALPAFMTNGTPAKSRPASYKHSPRSFFKAPSVNNINR
jgi:hypothetical protein